MTLGYIIAICAKDGKALSTSIKTERAQAGYHRAAYSASTSAQRIAPVGNSPRKTKTMRARPLHYADLAEGRPSCIFPRSTRELTPMTAIPRVRRANGGGAMSQTNSYSTDDILRILGYSPKESDKILGDPTTKRVLFNALCQFGWKQVITAPARFLRPPVLAWEYANGLQFPNGFVEETLRAKRQLLDRRLESREIYRITKWTN